MERVNSGIKTKQSILEDLSRSVQEFDPIAAEEAALEAIKIELDPVEAIEKGLAEGMKIVGEKFDRFEMYLPEVMLAAEAMDKAVEVLNPHLPKETADAGLQRKVVIGTVKGDVHEIGKKVVILMFKAAGFKVHDLGKDVAPSTFVKAAKQTNSNIIAISALMTTTMPAMKDVLEFLTAEGMRNECIVLVGGGPVSQNWAEDIGADGYAKTAKEAVDVAIKLLSQR